MHMNITWVINMSAILISAIASIGLFLAAFQRDDKTTGGQMIALTIWGTAGWLVLSFFELFITNHALSYSIAVFATAMVVGILLVSMTVPDKPLRWPHWLVLASILPLCGSIGTPGIVYMDIIPMPDGYSDLVPGPYFDYQQGALVAYMILGLVVYIYRMYHERNPATRALLRVFAIGQGVFLLVAAGSIIILPAIGYNEFNGIGTAFSLVFVMATMTYGYTSYSHARATGR